MHNCSYGNYENSHAEQLRTNVFNSHSQTSICALCKTGINRTIKTLLTVYPKKGSDSQIDANYKQNKMYTIINYTYYIMYKI